MADEEQLIVTLDGKIHDAATPFLYVDDLAIMRGDGVFETVLVRGGAACTIELHLDRLRRSAEMLDLPEISRDEWRHAVHVAVTAWGSAREGLMRIVLSRGRQGADAPTAFLTVAPVPEAMLDARNDGVSVVTVNRGYSVELGQDAPWLLFGAKTLSYATNLAAARFARRMGADDAIFLSTEGRVLEGTRSTVLVSQEDKLITPPHSYPIVAGTTQRALFEYAERSGFTCEYRPLFAADLIMAEGLWLLSSVTVAARVTKLDGLTMFEPDNASKITSLIDESIRRIATLAR